MNQLPVNEEFLQQVELLQTLVKNNVAGNFGGNHKSKSYGSSCEFADYRDYMAGDEIKKIDWNAYARFDKLYLKLYLDERQLHTRIYIDASRSVGYGNAKKDEQAIKIAAALAYLSVCEMDKVSVYIIKDKQATEIISGMSGRERYYNEIGKLNDIVFEGDSYISDALLPSTVGYGDGMSVIISDFLTDNNYEYGIDHLISKKRDVFCVQVLSSEELNPKARGKMHFFDSEDISRTYRKNINREIIQAYRQALEYATGRIRGFCLSRGAEYLLVPAEKPLNEIFFGDLAETGVVK
ncbi:MAG: DUF58 domain-containing protein [Clostridia bacterium]|nr:DUF58 domain-containing protein [Clostridia bacterium]